MAAVSLNLSIPSSPLLISRRTPPLVRLSTNKSSSSSSSSSLSSIGAVRRKLDGVYHIVSCLPSFKPSTKLFVSGLSFRTTKESLENAFKNFGQLLEVNLVMDKITNRPRGFAFLRYAKDEESKKAIEGMHGKEGVICTSLPVASFLPSVRTHSGCIIEVASTSTACLVLRTLIPLSRLLRGGSSVRL